MLTFLSTVIPVCGALYAAFSALAERARVKRERAIRLRVAEVCAPLAATASERMGRHAYDSPEWHRERARADNLRRNLLEAHGLEDTRATYSGMVVDAAMATTAASSLDARRQWVLILSATAGVVLLAIDQMNVTP